MKKKKFNCFSHINKYKKKIFKRHKKKKEIEKKGYSYIVGNENSYKIDQTLDETFLMEIDKYWRVIKNRSLNHN